MSVLIMEYDNKKKEIKLDRKLSKLDRFVLDFCSLLDDYVIVSGYVSILLGRSRATEDVDLLIPAMSLEKFKELWKKIHEDGFECINTFEVDNAYNMLKEHAIRFCIKGVPVPNIEFKIIKTDLDRYSFENKVRVFLAQGELKISPLELQIAYKLFLAADGIEEELRADKDIEDARHLYKIFGQKINKEEFLFFVNKLRVEKRLKLLK
jgi:hypothetical protein